MVGLKYGNISSATSTALSQPLFSAKSLVCFQDTTKSKNTSSELDFSVFVVLEGNESGRAGKESPPHSDSQP